MDTDFNKDYNENYKDTSLDADDDSFYERKPQSMDYDIFSLRTNPKELLENFEMKLLNKYKKIIDDDKGHYKLEQIPGTKPLCNKQGVQEILLLLSDIINNHTVQGHTLSHIEHLHRMKGIAYDVHRIFWIKREKWALETPSVNYLIDSICHMIELFLSRTIGNKERELYGESFKESTNREIKPMVNNDNVFRKISNFMK